VFIFAGAKCGEIVLKWDVFNYATKFRAMAIYVVHYDVKKKGGTLTTLLCQIFTVLAHRSTKMKLCDSRKHFIPNLSKPEKFGKAE
jgi:hypothetical protein